MRVYMIAAILRVVFEDEENRVVPEGRVGDGFDRAPHCKIVIGYRGLRRWAAGFGSRGVVVA